MHKLHLPVVGKYGCTFSRIFHVTVWSALVSYSFQMCSLSDVADDLCLSLKLDVCWLYHVLNSFSVICLPSLCWSVRRWLDRGLLFGGICLAVGTMSCFCY